MLSLGVGNIFAAHVNQTNQESIEVVSNSLQLLRYCHRLGRPKLQPVQSRLQPVAQLC